MEPDDYQEQQDSLNINEQTWRDGSSGGLGGDDSTRKNEGTNSGSMDVVDKKEKSPFSIKDYEQQLALWSTPEFKKGYQALLDEMNGKQPLKETTLPMAEELSERFGGSFAPILERFKEQIRFEIEDGTMALRVPLYLDVLNDQLSFIFREGSDYANVSLKDSENKIGKTIYLELCRVDINIVDNDVSDVGDRTGTDQKKINILPEESCRDIDENGIVVNPGIGDEWILLKLHDAKNDRNLEVRFKVYFQIPKSKPNDIDKHLLKP